MSFLSRLWDSIKSLFAGLRLKSQVWVHIAITTVEGIKAIMETPVPDVLTAIIPGGADDKAVAIIREWVPKVLLELNMVESIADITDVNEQLNAILAKLKLSSDVTKNIVYHGLASMIIDKLSDGKFTWADAVAVAQYYYDHLLNTPEAVTPAQVVEGQAEAE